MAAADVSSVSTQEGYLGPGRVVETDGRRVEVLLDDGQGPRRPVELALTFPYEPAPGDRLLVVGQGSEHYAIGLLSGRAPSSLAFQGDVEVHAVGGTLTLHGDEGIEVDAPRVTLRARTLRAFAETLHEKADEIQLWVSGLLNVQAGEARRVVTGEDRSVAGQQVILAKGAVKVDGHSVQLGH